MYEVASGDVEWLFVPLEAAAKMRASFMLLGPLLARFGRVIISNPGGDRIGRRPVDLHVEAMRTLGATIDYRNGYYFATAPGRLRGTEIRFPFVSVMGTENAMLAATLADGHTVIRPAAREPEVDDLIVFLQKMGADVERTYPDTIEVRGKRRLRGAEHHVIPDRIEAGTFAVAGAVTGGQVTLTGAPCDHMTAFLEVLGRAGVEHSCDPGPDRGRRRAACSTAGSRPCDIETAPYPGLRDRHPAADLRPAHPGERDVDTSTRRSSRTASSGCPSSSGMGAKVDIIDTHHATIRGRTPLHGAEAEIGDLRAGASLILAALAADGESTIHGAHHVQRGYENIERKFADLGARIARLEEGTVSTSS